MLAEETGGKRHGFDFTISNIGNIYTSRPHLASDEELE